MMSDHYLDLEWRLDKNLTPMENQAFMKQLAAEGEELLPPDEGSWETYNPFENPEDKGRDSQW